MNKYNQAVDRSLAIDRRVRAGLSIEQMLHRFLTSVQLLLILLLPLTYFIEKRQLLYTVILSASLVLIALREKTKQKNLPDVNRVLVVGICLVIYQMLHSIFWPSQGALERNIQTIVPVTVFLSTASVRFSHQAVKLVGNLVTVLSLLLFFLQQLHGGSSFYYGAFYGHSNALGTAALSFFALILISLLIDFGFFRLIGLLTTVLIVFYSYSRSALITLIAFMAYSALMYMIQKRSTGRRYLSPLFLGTIAIALTFSIVYPKLYGTSFGNSLEVLSRNTFGKNFFSGREIVWNNILEHIEKSPYFGHGLSVVPSTLFDTVFSSHNLYLQTLLQTGVIGLLLVLLLFWTVLGSLNNASNRYTVFGSAFFLAFLLHECLEVSLTQNTLELGISVWFCLGLFVSMSQEKEVDFV